MSWKAEFYSDNEWCTNGLSFETKEESDTYGAYLFRCWSLPIDYRSVESDEPVNYKWDFEKRKTVRIEGMPPA